MNTSAPYVPGKWCEAFSYYAYSLRNLRLAASCVVHAGAQICEGLDHLHFISCNGHFWRMILSGILGLDFGFFASCSPTPDGWLLHSWFPGLARELVTAGNPLKPLVWVYQQYSSRYRMIITREHDRWAKQVPMALNCSRRCLVTLCNCMMWPSHDCFYSVFSYVDCCTQFLIN